MYLLKLLSFFSLALTFSSSENVDTALYNALCKSIPGPNTEFRDFKEVHPKDGWNVVLGNKLDRRIHAGVTSPDHNLKTNSNVSNNTCFQTKLIQASDTRMEGEFIVFKNLHGNWKCGAEVDEYGLLTCVMKSDGPKPRGEVVQQRFGYSDHQENLHLVISCYPHRQQVGWHSLSITNELTEQQKNTIVNIAEYLGFPPDSAVSWCTDFNLLV